MDEIELSTLWNEVVQALQSEISRAQFETWLQETRVVGVTNGNLVIMARNAYARDWLESRLQDTCEGILRAWQIPLGIRFVSDDEDGDGGPMSEDSEDVETEDGRFAADAVHATLYQAIVQPEKVVLLPGYALRLLEQGDLTPKQMSLWVGFRQAVYLQAKAGRGTIRDIPHWEVRRFAMMSRASYFRELARGHLAGGLVEKLDTGSMGDANRYRVQMEPFLTRRDSAALGELLRDVVAGGQTIAEKQQLALEALRSLLRRSPVEYLDGAGTPPDEDWPRQIPDIVRHVLGEQAALALPVELVEAAEQVQNHLLRAYGKVLISHHFLRTVAPGLGLSHPQAWAIIMLRDRCWYDHDNHIQHNFAIVPGGLETLAGWVGVTRKSVEGWLKKNEFAAFVSAVETSAGGPEANNETQQDWLSRQTIFSVRQDEPLDLEKVRLGLEKMRLDLEKVRLTLEKMRLDLEKVRLSPGKSETLLITSIKPQLNPIKPQELPPPAKSAPKTEQASWVVVSSPAPGQWVLDRILQGKVISPKVLQRVRGGSGEALVSWLLYALSPEGTGIARPWNYALDRLSQDPWHGAGGKYDQLAALPPDTLLTLAQAASKGHLLNDFPGGDLWFDVMGSRSGERAVTLMRLLWDADAPRTIEREHRVETWRQVAGGWELSIAIENEQV